MRRLLLSLGLAILVGGVAVAVNADQRFGDHTPSGEVTAVPDAARPRGISDLPLVDQPTVDLPTVDQPTVDQPTVDQPAGDRPVADRVGAPTVPACRREEMLVKFKPGADPATVAARYGASVESSIPQIGVFVLAVPPGTGAATLAALAADPDVEYAEPNGVMRVPELPPTPDPCAEETPSPALPVPEEQPRP